MNISIINEWQEIEKEINNNDPTILITGDFCPDRRIIDLVKNQDYNKIYNNFLPYSKSFDISITNLECPLTERESQINKVGPLLKGPPEAIHALKHAGFNLVSLANNHIMDQGTPGFEDTLELLDSNDILYVGAGRSLHEAQTPRIITIKGVRIGFLNIAEHEFSIATDEKGGAAPVNEVDNYYQIMKVKDSVDFLILIIHGGHELFSLPSPRMKELYRYYIDLGVDAVIGHHAHVFSGYEIYNGKPIFYNIGNFVFDRDVNDESWYRGFGVGLQLHGNGIKNIYLIPYTQCKPQVGVKILSNSEIEEFSETIKNYNDIISDDKKLNIEFEKFIKKMQTHYLSTLLGLGKIKRQMLKRGIFPGFFINKKRLIRNLNLFRCQAHHDAIVKILKNEVITS